MLITADELSTKLGYSSLQSRKTIGFCGGRRAEMIVNQLEDAMKFGPKPKDRPRATNKEQPVA
jgi:hypothetical protein